VVKAVFNLELVEDEFLVVGDCIHPIVVVVDIMLPNLLLRAMLKRLSKSRYLKLFQ